MKNKEYDFGKVPGLHRLLLALLQFLPHHHPYHLARSILQQQKQINRPYRLVKADSISA